MKNVKEFLQIMIVIIALIAICFGLVYVNTANAQTFNLQLYHVNGSIYRGVSGVVVITEDCDIPDYELSELHYFNNPSDSSVGPLYDNLTYTAEEAYVTSESTVGYRDVMITCDVLGVARLRSTGTTPAVDTSRSVYDSDSERLYVYDTKIVEKLQDTGRVFPYAQLRWNGTFFVIEEVIE